MRCKSWDKETKECTNGCLKYLYRNNQCCIHCELREECREDNSICNRAVEIIGRG